jgi:hypothetical protein
VFESFWERHLYVNAMTGLIQRFRFRSTCGTALLSSLCTWAFAGPVHADICDKLLEPESRSTQFEIDVTDEGKLAQIETVLKRQGWWAADSSGLIIATKLDLDGDGSDEYFVRYDTGGQLRSMGVAILAEDLSFKTYEDIGIDQMDPLEEASHFRQHDGRIYLMWNGFQSNRISFASTFKAWKHRLVCEFGEREPELRVFDGQDPAICAAIVEKRVEQASFDQGNSIGRAKQCFNENSSGCTRADSDSAAIDIDGDGATELVVRMNHAYEGGQMCYHRYLAVTNIEGTSPEVSARNSTLRELSPPCEGLESLPIRYNNDWYVYTRPRDGYRSNRTLFTVARLRNGMAETVCRISENRTLYVIR